jgi:REP element-mobilizing transposase RayT
MRTKAILLNFAARKTKPSFGGNFKSNPKSARPISTKLDMHVILKSPHARGKLSLSRHERWMLATAQRLGMRFNIQIKDLVAMSNHVHIRLRARHRKSFGVFMAALSGLIARRVLGAERGRPSSIAKFFEGRPFSRIIAAGTKSYQKISAYFNLNRLEKKGLTKEQSRSFGLIEMSYLELKECLP